MGVGSESDIPIAEDIPSTSKDTVSNHIPLAEDIPSTSKDTVSNHIPLAEDIPSTSKDTVSNDILIAEDIPTTSNDIPTSNDIAIESIPSNSNNIPIIRINSDPINETPSPSRSKSYKSPSVRLNLTPDKYPDQSVKVIPSPSIISIKSDVSVENFNYKKELWIENDGVNLMSNIYIESKDILMSHEWLTSDIIDAACEILHSQFPTSNGLQSVLYGSQLENSYKTVLSPFQQILNRSALDGGTHWLLASNLLNCNMDEVCIYDSSFSDIPFGQKCIIAGLLKPQIGQNVDIKLMNVVKQKNTYDCGVYAIAYATSLPFNIDPCTIEFAENKLRRHLIKCLERKEFSPFHSVPRHIRNY